MRYDELFEALMALEPVDRSVTDGIDGWLTSDEEAALWAIGRHATGDILEVGPWLGRSTACIAAGVSHRQTSVSFTTVELNPTVENWRESDGLWYFVPDPDLPPLGANSEASWRQIEEVVSHPLGVIGLLRENLRRVGLESFVHIESGDFRSLDLGGPFSAVFSDTMHTPDEIRRYASYFRDLVVDGGVFACHDMTPENRDALGVIFSFVDEVQIDGLFIGRV